MVLHLWWCFLIRVLISKTFKLVGTGTEVPSTSKQSDTTNWKLCVICQQEKGESLTCPSKSKRKDSRSGYKSLAGSLMKFSELGQLPFQLERLDEGCGIEMTLVANSAHYHQSCRLKFKNT